jgi:hypothetical protein
MQAAAARYGIDPRAIAAAITWEFSENQRGYLTDHFIPSLPFFQDGYGWGQIHDSTLRGQMISGLNAIDSVILRNDLDRAIDLVASRIAQQADSYKSISGIDLRDNVPALVWMYNTSADYIRQSATDQLTVIHSGQVPTLNLTNVNAMTTWTQANLGRFNFVPPSAPIVVNGILYYMK